MAETPQFSFHSGQAMDDLIKLVKTYRVTTSTTERQQLGGEIFELIEPSLHRSIFLAVRHEVAEEIFQEVAKAIATGLHKFRGNTKREFLGWVKTIRSNKLKDHFDEKKKKPLELIDPEILWEMIADDAHSHPLSAADRMDLEEAMKLLAEAKPGCDEYLVKYYIDDLDYADIAEEEDLSKGAVRMRINRCLEDVRELVK